MPAYATLAAMPLLLRLPRLFYADAFAATILLPCAAVADDI